ncbi:MAG TPA: hypothetical protein VN258_19400 [Mobilitalea sp.]|nr:hypothetical protein [Mobilitalea sp.]
MVKVFKVKVLITLIVMSCLIFGGTLANAATTTFMSTLPSNGTHVRSSVEYKTTGDDCSYITPSSNYGVLLYVNCQTLCNIGGGQIITSNPETVAKKDESTYLGVYVTLDLQPNQMVWLDQWTYVKGTSDVAYTTWDYR